MISLRLRKVMIFPLRMPKKVCLSSRSPRRGPFALLDWKNAFAFAIVLSCLEAVVKKIGERGKSIESMAIAKKITE